VRLAKIGLVVVLAVLAVGVYQARSDAHEGHADAKDATVTPVWSGALPNAPGQTLTAVLVTYPPGGKSPAHRHAGSVFAYVLSGSVRSQSAATGPVKVYQAGQSFFEPEGSEHLVSENASATKPARFLVVFVAPDGATLTTYSK
jgi:quercetin dioxygenase-like cupin family protein